NGSNTPYPTVTTDSHGHFVRDNIYFDTDAARIDFYKDGYARATARFQIAPGERRIDVVIRMEKAKTGVVSGRILDARGSGAPGIGVTLYFYRGSRLLTGPTTYSNDRGEYRLFNVTPRLYFLGFADAQRAS